VPTGADWQHEVKFDGYRVQIHKAGKDVVIFSRNGHDFTTRFADITYLLRDLPAKNAIFDGEIVASNAAGVPDFTDLHRRTARQLQLG
jgi:bifunctional non-homologous end joining protein LigD